MLIPIVKMFIDYSHKLTEVEEMARKYLSPDDYECYRRLTNSVVAKKYVERLLTTDESDDIILDKATSDEKVTADELYWLQYIIDS